ncbi:hypothetical protein ACOMHN_024635 [Nucella lapillus]
MEWERKFYDIIQETESNLARARMKLHGRSLPKDTERSLDTLAPLQQPLSSVHPKTSTRWDSSVSSALYRSLPRASHLPDAVCSVSPRDSHSSEMGQLLNKIDSQNLMIDRLGRLVKTLNQEKDQYRRHITDLQGEVGDINSKLNETKYLNPHLETQVDLMRHEVRSDMHRLHNMISTARNSSLHSTGLERSFKDMQYSVHGELEGIHRDLNVMSHRIGRLELDVSTHGLSQRDLHDRLNAGILASSFAGPLVARGSLLGGQSSMDMSHVKDLRSTVSQLHDKLDSLEGRLAAASSVAPLQSPRLLTGYQKLYRPTVTTRSYRHYDEDDDDDDDSIDLDELDLSDLDLSSDNDDDDDDNNPSDDLEMIIKSSALKGKVAAGLGRSPKMTLADLDLSSDDQPSVSSEGADFLSDLDLENLDLSSMEGSLDLGSGEGGSTRLNLDDL